MAAEQGRCVLDQRRGPEYVVDIYLRQMCQMLASQHEATQAMGANKFQQLVKEDVAAALGAGVLQYLVSMTKAEERSTRAAAAAALAVLSASSSGRDATRVAGALPLLVMLLDEGPSSPAAEHAAKALMNAAVSDVGKDTIHSNGGVPSLLQLLIQGSELSLQQQRIRSVTGDPALPPCPAAVHAVGAISNILQAQCKRIRKTVQKVNGLSTLQTVALKHRGNVLGARAQLAATMLTQQLAADTPQKAIADAAVGLAGRAIAVAASPAPPAVNLPNVCSNASSSGGSTMQRACHTSEQPITADSVVVAAATSQVARRTTAEQLAEQLNAVSKPKAPPKQKTSNKKRAVVKEPIDGLADALALLGAGPGLDPVHAVGVATGPAGLRGPATVGARPGGSSGSKCLRGSSGKLSSKRVSIAESVKSSKGEGQEQKDGCFKWVV